MFRLLSYTKSALSVMWTDELEQQERRGALVRWLVLFRTVRGIIKIWFQLQIEGWLVATFQKYMSFQ